MKAMQAGNGEVPGATRTGKARGRVNTLPARPISTSVEYQKKIIVLPASQDSASVANVVSVEKRPARSLASSLVNWLEGMRE
jgi:hypothetical protein